MFLEETRLGVLIAMWAVSIIFTSVGWYVEYPTQLEWLRFLIRAFAVIFTFLAIVYTVDAIWARATIRVVNYRRARITHLLHLSDALKGLTPRQTEIINKYDLLEIVGIMGTGGRIVWSVKGLRMNVPLEFFQDFILMSEESAPRLFAIRNHPEFRRETGWTNAEENLTEATRILINAGLAEYDKPTKTAKLTVPWYQVAEGLGIERKLIE